MSQRLVTPNVNTNIPDSYPSIEVKSNPVGLGSSGIVVIIGEAEGGPSYSEVALKDNSFAPNQLDKVTQKYLSGQIVDAMRALSSPSNDRNITGTANRVFIVKTNKGAKASAVLDTDYGSLTDKNFGKPGNKYKYQITSIAAEVAPKLEGSTIVAFGAALNAATFDIRLNGSVKTTITLSGTAGDHADVATLVVELNAQLPAGIVAAAGTASNSIKLTVAADSAAYRKGWAKSFELVDTSADLASLGLVQGLKVSSQEPGVEVAVSRSDTGLNETKDISSAVALEIGYLGTSCSLTISKSAQTLTTTAVGGSGASLTIDMSQYRTLSDLATYIAAQTGYSAAVNPAAQQLPCTALDSVTAIGIAASEAGVKAGRVKMDSFSFARAINTSGAVVFAATASAGLPNPMANPSFLAGGTRGSTSNADILAAIDQIAGIQCNIIVPLFSRNASDDIAEGLTDSGSAYTIGSINAAVKSHCIAYSTPLLKRNRMAILSIWDTYANAKIAAQSLASYRTACAMQKATQLDSSGNSVSFLPWYSACVAAGMQAGGFYKSIVNKFANVISFTDPDGYDSGSPGDVSDALDAGLLILTQETAGSRWVSDQTTYGYDTNFVYNSIQAVYLSDILALDLANSFRQAFVGQSLADVDVATALSFLAQKMDGYKKLKMIASSDDAPLGYKNPKATISGPELDISVEVKLATSVYFIPIAISLSEVQQSS